jgi:hypothetical protein
MGGVKIANTFGWVEIRTRNTEKAADSYGGSKENIL